MNRWLTRLFQKGLTEKRLDAELRFHLEQRVRDLMASGLPEEEARRRANVAFGGLEQVKQDCRDARVENRVEALLRDFQYAFRSLAKDRGFTLITIFALALGISATTVMFSVIYNVVFDPFPYKDFQHSVVFDIRDLNGPSDGVARVHYTIPEFLAVREQNRVFEDIVGNFQLDVLYTDGKGARRFRGGYVTTNGFDFLGVPPFLGRVFTPEDDKPGGPLVFLMNYKLWQTEFHCDPKILGTSLFLNGKPRTLVGIMPRRFNGYDASVWFPLSLRPGADGTIFPVKNPTVIWALARLKKGVSVEAAAADVDAIVHRLAQNDPEHLYPQRFRVAARTLMDYVVGDFKTTLYVLLAAVFMLLLIACANVMNLLLARATVREREIALRASLGAGRGRLVRQLVVESFVLAGAACLAGCLFAYVGLKGLMAIVPRGPIPEETVIGLNPAVLLFALAIAVLATLLCGLAPALHAVRDNLHLRLIGGGRGAGGGFRHGKLRSVLVVAEVALSIVLMTGSGLLMRNFFTLTHVDLGFAPERVLYATVAPAPDDHYDNLASKKIFFEQILRRVAGLPGVISATESLSLPPFAGAGSELTIQGKSGTEHMESFFDLCSESYFRTFGLRVLRGRLLSETDIASARHVAVINEAFARDYFKDGEPLGRKIKFNVFDELPDTPRDAYFEVIGVVSDFKNYGLLAPPAAQAFLPYSISGLGHRVILASTAVDPKSLLSSVQREIWAVDSNAAITQSGSIQDVLAQEAYVRPQFGVIAIGAFAGISLALVLIGIFSVMAYNVALQTHDIGVRMALGAQRGNVLAMVLWQGLRLIAAGIVIGVFASLGLTHFLADQVSSVSVTDPPTFVAVVIAFLAVGLLASLLPARRAAGTDPLTALHYE